jgi:hypothetical protein
LRVPEQIAFRAAEETWEGYLVGKRPLAHVLPLALPEWRQCTPVGALRFREEGLQLELEATGSAMFAPLFIDLNPRRFGKAITWRQLTVAESLQIQPPDVAAAYRVQCGKKQWLLYRSLASRGNRTVLGHNLCSEFLCARFERRGEVTALVEIE